MNILNRNTEEIIFSSKHITIKETVEEAIKKGISLIYANLIYADLSNANLRNSILINADLSNANLRNANLTTKIQRFKLQIPNSN